MQTPFILNAEFGCYILYHWHSSFTHFPKQHLWCLVMIINLCTLVGGPSGVMREIGWSVVPYNSNMIWITFHFCNSIFVIKYIQWKQRSNWNWVVYIGYISFLISLLVYLTTQQVYWCCTNQLSLVNVILLPLRRK